MNNRQLAKTLQLIGNLMDLHEENPFKSRSYSSAYRVVRNWPEDLSNLDLKELMEIQGVGKTIANDIYKLAQNGTTEELSRLKSITPSGIIDLLSMKGLGPKKLLLLWKDLGIETPGELLYACQENRLIELKGFGLKTQKNLLDQVQYFISSQGKNLFARVEELSERIIDWFHERYSEEDHSLCGAVRRKDLIIDKVEILTTSMLDPDKLLNELKTEIDDSQIETLDIRIYNCEPENFYSKLFELTGDQEFLNGLSYTEEEYHGVYSEDEIFEDLQIPFVPSDLRYGDLYRKTEIHDLVTTEDVKGVIHAHSTYSDGVNSLKEMAVAAKALSYEYLLITDHSKSAFYANGLVEERLEMQWREIDTLNQMESGFKIYKGIESDILSDGSLDYDLEILKEFDVIIASIHSNLKMNMDKATNRLIKAIENPYTRILGHPTGRLLLARPGYPIDYIKVIDACIANNVVIELNANPQRLDIEYKFISMVLDKGGLISINPDAHSIKGIEDIKYGVMAARKGGLYTSECLSCFNKEKFESWMAQK